MQYGIVSHTGFDAIWEFRCNMGSFEIEYLCFSLLGPWGERNNVIRAN